MDDSEDAPEKRSPFNFDEVTLGKMIHSGFRRIIPVHGQEIHEEIEEMPEEAWSHYLKYLRDCLEPWAEEQTEKVMIPRAHVEETVREALGHIKMVMSVLRAKAEKDDRVEDDGFVRDHLFQDLGRGKAILRSLLDEEEAHGDD